MSHLEPRNFLQPCLLLLLREQPDHGYELVSRLRPLHAGDGDAGGVYRALRAMERQGLVRSEWQTSEAGPARRTYYVTEAGAASLHEQAADLEQTHAAIHSFLERYGRLVAADRRRNERNGHDRRGDLGRGHSPVHTTGGPHHRALGRRT